MERVTKFVQPFAGDFGQRRQRDHVEEYVAGLVSNVKGRTSSRLPTARAGPTAVAEVHRPNPLAVAAHASRARTACWGWRREKPMTSGSSIHRGCSARRRGRWGGPAVVWLGGQGGRPGRYLPRLRYPQGARPGRYPVVFAQGMDQDKKRCREAGSAKEVRFRTRHELALEMLREHGGVFRTGGRREMTKLAETATFARNWDDERAVPVGCAVQHPDPRSGRAAPSYGGLGSRRRYPFNVRTIGSRRLSTGHASRSARARGGRWWSRLRNSGCRPARCPQLSGGDAGGVS